VNDQVRQWLPQVIIESALIVVSILVALALDNWRQEEQNAELVRQSLSNFVVEISQNLIRIEDAAPFSRGLRNVLNNHYLQDNIDTVDDFVVMVESYTPASLQSTAWDSALATGSLAKMQYSLVTALSLTYNLQQRYDLITRSGVSTLTSPQNLTESNLKLAVYSSIRYLDEVTSMEAELAVTYSEAGTIVTEVLRQLEHRGHPMADIEPADLAHP
jgi:hypothetical protein